MARVLDDASSATLATTNAVALITITLRVGRRLGAANFVRSAWMVTSLMVMSDSSLLVAARLERADMTTRSNVRLKSDCERLHAALDAHPKGSSRQARGRRVAVRRRYGWLNPERRPPLVAGVMRPAPGAHDERNENTVVRPLKAGNDPALGERGRHADPRPYDGAGHGRRGGSSGSYAHGCMLGSAHFGP